MNHLISPSILASDFGNLQREIDMLNKSDADWIHVDVMDGMFVPNISFGFPVLQAVKKHAQKPLDVHLMIADPDRDIVLIEDGADIVRMHAVEVERQHRQPPLPAADQIEAGNPRQTIKGITGQDLLVLADRIAADTFDKVDRDTEPDRP